MSVSVPPPGTPVAPDDAAPVVAGAPVVKQTERPHPLTPLIQGWIIFLGIAVILVRELVPNGEDGGFEVGDLRWILPLVGLAILLAAAAGLVSWWFTRFVIDDEELRVETGALYKRSRKVPFERLQSVDLIQPLGARIFGLAELRLEAGAGDSTIRLRFLTRANAVRLREYLLARAHGQRARIADVEGAPSTSAFTDRSALDRPLVTVPPQRLVLAFLLSSDVLITLAVLLAVGVLSLFLGDVSWLALPALIPLVIGGVTAVSRRVTSMFNFTLSESERGLRIARGLTNLTSQSVPVDRIQGVKTSQPLLWRRPGWYRVDVDIVGYGAVTAESNEQGASSVLLPVTTREEVALAISHVLPGFALDTIELHASPPRPRWYRWYDYWTLRYGWNDRALVTEHGWLSRVRDVLPHAKTQSVRVTQGPLQRRLGLANVHFDTPKGPVDPVAQELAEPDARALALSQLDRARDARAADRERLVHRAVTADAVNQAGPLTEVEQPGEAALLAAFGTDRSRLVGQGGESEVFALDDLPGSPPRVLRLYRDSHEAPQRTVAHLRYLYDSWRRVDVGLELPLVLDAGVRDGRHWSIDRRFAGRNLSGWLVEAAPDQRCTALLSLLDAAARVPRLPSPVPGFARLVGEDAPQQFDSLTGLLSAMLQRPVQRAEAQLARDVPEVGQVWQQLQTDLAARVVPPALVHGDICPPNAYVSQAADGSPVVTGLGDFSPHTVHGDPLMDLAGAVAFVELEGYAGAVDDAAWLQSVAVQRWGPEVGRWIEVYRRFYAFYYSDTFDVEPALYRWCLSQLRR